MCKRSNKPSYVEEAELAEQRAFRRMCDYINSMAFEGWNDENIEVKFEYDEALDNLNASLKLWDKEESEPVFIHRKSTVAQQATV